MSRILLTPRAWALFGLLILLTSVPLLVACGGGEETADGDAVAAENGDDATADDKDTEDPESEDGKDEQEELKTRRQDKPVSVNVCNVARGQLVVPVIAEGTVRARHSADLRFEIAGRIERIAVSEGQSVRKGQLLATLDGREYRLRIDEAHSRYLQALGQVAVEEEGGSLAQESRGEELRALLEDLADLEARGEITRQERLDREIALGTQAVSEGGFRREMVEARSGLSTARADEDQARLNLERTEIRAPFGGVITGLTLANGEWVNAGQAFASLVDNVDIEAEVGVLESDLGALSEGRPALLAVPALGDTIAVTVDVISPRIDPGSRTCQVLLRLRSEDGRVKPGMFVRAIIAGEILEDRLIVPRSAILTRDGRPLLFKIDGEKAKWVYVRLGQRNDLFVEIERVLQGGPLDPGTPVVVSDHLTLAHDAKIKVKKTVTPPDAWATFHREG